MDNFIKQPSIISKYEKWSRWDPGITNLNGKYNLKRIVDEMGRLKVYLTHHNTNQHIKAVFDSVWAHRNTYETFRMFLVSELSDLYGDEFYTNWSFFKVDNSSYMKWLSLESAGLVDNPPLTHFVIMGTDFIADIVTAEEPKIKFINN